MNNINATLNIAHSAGRSFSEPVYSQSSTNRGGKNECEWNTRMHRVIDNESMLADTWVKPALAMKF